ncbi:4-hydroxybenzoyl-CoA reductase subunit gamma [Hartmannibacter diazotrophicus]|uniref:4-hydroxybenzoyl-CoA reductase subunit gamma n=1 Tax=Hartmannibacter diazotrophicus TaxID=1482074 RepID=A0A2C9D828_9HYPH|nr:xanthine dehydrogenase small subunit [Hartmannibacter diazotrophicus]SON56484.1 4-hydroxybenzoyl-CoA reductase subunit gamma [Hartmannibacter diazotrophicus]
MRDTIRFLRAGKIVELSDVGPTETLLDYLRLREGSCGTKEGCNEGDCGACTVAVGAPHRGTIRYRPVNACIQLLGMLDGKEIVTVEDLADGDILHPVQAAMVDHHGSQCGFCTPGIVMSLFTLYHAGKAADRFAINDCLAGNLCRCTGYRPIVDAAKSVCTGEVGDRFAREADATVGILQFLSDRQDIFIGNDKSFFAAPRTIDSLADLYLRHPDATLVAGATDVGLWVTKQLRKLPKVIHLGRILGMSQIEDIGDAILIGASATFEDAMPHFSAIDPDFGEMMRRVGSKQVRAAGTVGGNVANGSPIGDTPPVLIALGSTVELRKGNESRALPLESFFIDYGKQDRERGEFVAGLMVPKLAANQHLRVYKISKRFDQDISALLGAFRFTVEEGVITEARIAFGGMAGTPRRAYSTEERLIGTEPSKTASWGTAREGLSIDFKPLSDMRASDHYRLETAWALLAKALVELAGAPSEITRVIGRREADAAFQTEALHV